MASEHDCFAAGRHDAQFAGALKAQAFATDADVVAAAGPDGTTGKERVGDWQTYRDRS